MNSRNRFILTACVCVGACLASVRCDVNPRMGLPDGDSAIGSGTLRVLVTDKPFPLDLIEEATITIARVEVRREGGLPGCLSDVDCDDELFCSGVEVCDTATEECQDGDAPCGVGEVCDEANDACALPCSGGDCDDGQFCNGVEHCDLDTGLCEADEEPCAWHEECDEENDTCEPTFTGGDDDDGDDDDDDDGDDDAWLEIFNGSKTFNLLDLQNGRTDLLADLNVPAGTYTQMRLIVTQGTVKLRDIADTFVLTVPSGAQTGIKLHFTFEVHADGETTLLLDVDLSRAFKPIPGSGADDPSRIRTFHFTPSVAMRLINLLEAGSITGRVVDDNGVPLWPVNVTVFDDEDDAVTSGGTDEQGMYTILGLSTGVYRLEFWFSGFHPAELTGVDVTAGETDEQDDVVMMPDSSTP